MSRVRHDEDPAPAVAVTSPRADAAERPVESAMRPTTFDDYVGQEALKKPLYTMVRAAQQRGEALDHLLFYGPPGLGKTTLAHIVASEIGVGLHQTSGPAIEHKGVLAAMLTNIGPRDVLFIDEIHRLPAAVEESLYPAMEDFQIDVIIGDGPHAKSLTMPLPPFTLVGATTRTGLLTSPLRDRFGFSWRLSYYTPDELTAIIERSAARLGVAITRAGAAELGRRARGTPRVANRWLRRARDYAQVEGDGSIDEDIADQALRELQVDHAGLNPIDRGYLRCLVDRFNGGPVGIEALAAALSEDRLTVEDMVEPYLVQQGFVDRTKQGRMATRLAYEHLHLPTPAASGPNNPQGSLF